MTHRERSGGTSPAPAPERPPAAAGGSKASPQTGAPTNPAQPRSTD